MVIRVSPSPKRREKTAGRAGGPPTESRHLRRLGPPPTLTEPPEQDSSHGGSRQHGPQGDGDAQGSLGLWGKGGRTMESQSFLAITLSNFTCYF